MTISKNSKEPIIFYLSLFCLVFFSMLLMNTYIIKSENTIFGALQETLTIPMLLGNLVIFIFSLKTFIRTKFNNNFNTVSLVISSIILVISIVSFL